MKYLFLDPIPGGHRPQHVLAYCRYLRSRPDLQVVFAIHPKVKQLVLGTAGFDQPGNAQFVGLEDALVDSIKSNNKDVRGGIKVLNASEHLAKDNHCEQIHFMHLDTFLPALVLRLMTPGKGMKYSGLYFKPTSHYKRAFSSELEGSEVVLNKLKTYCIKSLLRSRQFKSLLTLDPYYCSEFSDKPYANKLHPIPDLSSPPEYAERPLDVPQQWLDRRVRLFLFGALSARKGVFVLLKALQEVDPNLLGEVGLLLTGQVDTRERELLMQELNLLRTKQPSLELHLMERYVSDKELWWLLKECTIVAMPYQRHVGFSGVMCWAAAADRPILTQSFGLVGRETREHSLGTAVDTSDSRAVAEALSTLCRGEDVSETNRLERKQFAQSHTEKSFAEETFRALGH